MKWLVCIFLLLEHLTSSSQMNEYTVLEFIQKLNELFVSRLDWPACHTSELVP